MNAFKYHKTQGERTQNIFWDYYIITIISLVDYLGGKLAVMTFPLCLLFLTIDCLFLIIMHFLFFLEITDDGQSDNETVQ